MAPRRRVSLDGHIPGCSLIDAPVDARGLMHSHSLLPSRHVDSSPSRTEVRCHEAVLKRFKGRLHLSGPLRAALVLDVEPKNNGDGAISRSPDWN